MSHTTLTAEVMAKAIAKRCQGSEVSWRGYLTQANAALKAAVPEGCVVVPREPTTEMVVAAAAHIEPEWSLAKTAIRVYKAMLDQAQKGGE